MSEFNYKKYWIKRHNKIKDYSSVGIKSIGNKANELSYNILLKRYEAVLEKLELKKSTTFLDAGAGIGILSSFLAKNKFDVTAIDISTEALDQIKNKRIKTHCSKISTFKNGNFEVVQCFDVLYHITDDGEWQKSIKALCALSKDYVILHQRFLKIKPLINPSHIKFRSYKDITLEMQKNGFREVLSVPSHVVQRVPIYILYKIMPVFLSKIDNFLLKNWPFGLLGISSHEIKVFKQQGEKEKEKISGVIYNIKYFEKEFDGQKSNNKHYNNKAKNVLTMVLPIKRGEKILDIGTCSGTFAFECAKHKCNVIGTDLSAIAIKKCNEISSKKKIENVKFIVCSADKQPFQDEHFDKIIMGAFENL